MVGNFPCIHKKLCHSEGRVNSPKSAVKLALKELKNQKNLFVAGTNQNVTLLLFYSTLMSLAPFVMRLKWFIVRLLLVFQSEPRPALLLLLGYLPPLTKLATQTEFSQLEKDCSGSSKDRHGL